MSLLTVSLLVAGYVALVAIVLAMLTTAKRADEAAAAQAADPKAADARNERARPAQAGGGRFRPTDDDAEFLAERDQRASRELERVPRPRRPPRG
jgi:hypothetical protein